MSGRVLPCASHADCIWSGCSRAPAPLCAVFLLISAQFCACVRLLPLVHLCTPSTRTVPEPWARTSRPAPAGLIASPAHLAFDNFAVLAGPSVVTVSAPPPTTSSICPVDPVFPPLPSLACVVFFSSYCLCSLMGIFF